jgi:N-acetylglucosaminyldiphosphoundecaprenol N-acetyl-beta-D-mannosaminyltransferase
MEQVVIQGIPVAQARWQDVIALVATSIRTKHPTTIGYVNVHVLNQAAKHPELADFLTKLDLCYCDGRGVQLAARLQGNRLPERLTGADWIYPLCLQAREKSWRIGWFGGEYGVSAAAARRLRQQIPGLDIVVTEHGFQSVTSTAQAVARINAAQPDILLVGMGTPLQEDWVRAHRGEIHAPVVWCLGATADFVSGKTPRGPKWLAARHEWLARLLVEPRRLAWRYMIGNPRFFLRLLRSTKAHE